MQVKNETMRISMVYFYENCKLKNGLIYPRKSKGLLVLLLEDRTISKENLAKIRNSNFDIKIKKLVYRKTNSECE